MQRPPDFLIHTHSLDPTFQLLRYTLSHVDFESIFLSPPPGHDHNRWELGRTEPLLRSRWPGIDHLRWYEEIFHSTYSRLCLFVMERPLSRLIKERSRSCLKSTLQHPAACCSQPGACAWGREVRPREYAPG